MHNLSLCWCWFTYYECICAYVCVCVCFVSCALTLTHWCWVPMGIWRVGGRERLGNGWGRLATTGIWLIVVTLLWWSDVWWDNLFLFLFYLCAPVLPFWVLSEGDVGSLLSRVWVSMPAFLWLYSFIWSRIWGSMQAFVSLTDCLGLSSLPSGYIATGYRSGRT